MYQAVFTHAVGDRLVQSTVLLCTRRRWKSVQHSPEWMAVPIGRLVLALRLRPDLSDGGAQPDHSLARRIAVVGDN